MRKTLSVCVLALVSSLTAAAQDLPKFDAFGGYSFVHFSQGQNSGGNVTSNLNGGSGSVAVYPNKWLGIVADFGGYKISTISQSGQSFDVDGNIISYLFGPRIRFGTRRVTPFGQVLFGGAHQGDITSNSTATCGPVTPCQIGDSKSAFAMTVEAGVDVGIAKHVAVRGQGGYLMTRFENGSGSVSHENNSRVSVGIVIH